MTSGGSLFYALNDIDFTQPVKVVSSMGQQSVGKSFSLNHLVDTSFAGSAMRTTGMIAQLMR
jgi:hypothetical protein